MPYYKVQRPRLVVLKLYRYTSSTTSLSSTLLASWWQEFFETHFTFPSIGNVPKDGHGPPKMAKRAGPQFQIALRADFLPEIKKGLYIQIFFMLSRSAL